jgi:uncharacterized protein DUF4832/glycosyl hydrolase family 42 (putative beta-galactosidase)
LRGHCFQASQLEAARQKGGFSASQFYPEPLMCIKKVVKLHRPVSICVAGLLLSVTLPSTASEPPELMVVRPVETDKPLSNPYMGWGLWAGPRYFDGRPFTLQYNAEGFGDDASLFSWVLVDWMWSDLEPREGQYYWKDLDTIISFWAARGKQIDLRVWVTDDPGWNGAPGNEVCPKWLWAAGARFREYVGEGKSKKREPDYVDPSYEKVYLPKVKRFLTALAERYDKPESPIVMWGAMGYGQWGEWHTYWSQYPWPNPEVKHNVLTKIVNMYADIFRVKQLRVACAPENNPVKLTSLQDYLYGQAIDVAFSKGFALACHGFIDGFSLYCKDLFENYWRKTPMWAESNWSYADVKNHHSHGTLDEYLQVYFASHSNYAHYYMDSDSYKRAMREDKSHFERGLQSGGLGYRLVLTEASWNGHLPAGNLFLLTQNWVNRNVGRLYKRHSLKVYLTDSQGNGKFSEVDRAFDQTDWVRGENYRTISVFHLARTLTPGAYDVRVALVDEAGSPRINLGIEGADSNKRYKLGTVQILPPESESPCDRARCP